MFRPSGSAPARAPRRGSVRGASLALAALALIACASCSPRRLMLANEPPQTMLFVQGPVDPVNHVVHLYWFGSDPDGFVTGFQIRFRNPAAPADTFWVPTARTDSLFRVFTPDSVSMPLFEVRAVDNTGQVDPSPAREDFTFTNKAATVTIRNKLQLADSTFATVSADWSAFDVDGDDSMLRFRIWLDGNEANARFQSARSITLPSADFLQSGAYLTGYRTLYIQAIDDGGRAGPPDSMRWFVQSPVTGGRARLLIIDDVPSVYRNGGINSNNFHLDSLYLNTTARNLPAGSWRVVRLQFSQPFRTAKDVEQTFKQFEAVLWYRGDQDTASTLLERYESGVAAYLDGGGRFYFEGRNPVDGLQTNGSLPAYWLSRYLGSTGLVLHETSVSGDSTADWTLNQLQIVRSSQFQDSLRLNTTYSGVRAFAVRDTDDVALWARPGAMTPGNTQSLALAVSVAQPSGGRVYIASFPILFANRRFPDNSASQPARYLAKVFAQLGLTGP